MVESIDYSNWRNPSLQAIAKQSDKDGIKGLNGIEVFDFARAAKEQGIDNRTISELFGMKFSSKNASDLLKSRNNRHPQFDNAVNYYNDKMDYSARYKVTNKTYSNLETRLYNMEKSIDQAFIDCAAYQDIVIVPRSYYKFYPYYNDRLLNFDIDEIRNLTSNDMNSLHELKDKIEYIMEEANGVTEHNEPERTEYDVEALAQKHLGMSYEEFVSKYSAELEFCKTVTAADLNSMTDTQRMVYGKAKAYATEMLNTTINEAHNVNWDAGERKLEETTAATDGMMLISDFEYDGITEEGLSNIKSGIMFSAFEDALVEAYNNSGESGIESVHNDNMSLKPRKVLENGKIKIYSPNGEYDIGGRRF